MTDPKAPAPLESLSSGSASDLRAPSDSVTPAELPSETTLVGLMQLTRISNLPTCWSNALVGYALAVASGADPSAGSLILVTIAISLMYCGGMAQNDVLDVEWDRECAAPRPIVGGRVRLFDARLVMWVGLAGGVLLVAPLGWEATFSALLLIAAIWTYNGWHKGQLWLSFVMMGACRVLAVCLAFDACGGIGALIGPEGAGAWGMPALALGAYVTVLTAAARDEWAKGGSLGRNLALLLAPLSIAAALLAPLSYHVTGFGDYGKIEVGLPTFVMGLMTLVWVGRGIRAQRAEKPRKVAAVLTYLSGICLMDATVLAAMGRVDLVIYALLYFCLTVFAHRKVLGT